MQSRMLQHFASLDPGRRVTSHKWNFLSMVSNSFAVLHRTGADKSVNTAPMGIRAKALKERMSIAAIAGAGISEKLVMFRAKAWTKKIPMKATKGTSESK